MLNFVILILIFIFVNDVLFILLMISSLFGWCMNYLISFMNGVCLFVWWELSCLVWLVVLYKWIFLKILENKWFLMMCWIVYVRSLVLVLFSGLLFYLFLGKRNLNNVVLCYLIVRVGIVYVMVFLGLRNWCMKLLSWGMKLLV